MAAAAPLLAPYDPYKDMDTPYLSPGREHLLGTNDIGQDILSEIIYGTRTSLAVGSISAVIAIFLGTVIGMVSGWYGGMIDRLFAKITAFFMIIAISSDDDSFKCTYKTWNSNDGSDSRSDVMDRNSQDCPFSGFGRSVRKNTFKQ